MSYPLRFYVAVLPNLPWPELVQRFQKVESLGFDMFDAASRAAGGMVTYYESDTVFADMVKRITSMGISDIGLYFPMREEQMPMFERIAAETIPRLKEEIGEVAWAGR